MLENVVISKIIVYVYVTYNQTVKLLHTVVVRVVPGSNDPVMRDHMACKTSFSPIEFHLFIRMGSLIYKRAVD